MREILFKAKRLGDGVWVEGFYIMHATSIEHPYSYANGKHCIQTVPHNFSYEVDPETVCQYTGLTDKNGKRFEGDIFQASDGDYIQRYIITWNEDALEWSAECVGDPDGTLPLCEFRVGEIEVVGNIFDNPELLEK